VVPEEHSVLPQEQSVLVQEQSVAPQEQSVAPQQESVLSHTGSHPPHHWFAESACIHAGYLGLIRARFDIVSERSTNVADPLPGVSDRFGRIAGGNTGMRDRSARLRCLTRRIGDCSAFLSDL